MSVARRAVVTLVLIAAALFFVPGMLAPDLALWWRALSAVGFVSALLGLRTLLGRVVIVRDRGLRLQKSWPLRREIPWYRILEIDVIPGFWNLEIELNSGERLALPCVDQIDDLYENMERHRQALDA
jgi:hypothetical protein